MSELGLPGVYKCDSVTNSFSETPLNTFMDTTELEIRNIIKLCCLPTPMTLASGGSPIFPLVVHEQTSQFIWPAAQTLWWGLSTNPGVTMWCVCGCS